MKYAIFVDTKTETAKEIKGKYLTRGRSHSAPTGLTKKSDLSI